jgi:protein-L-isoaspartate O-methyltransferase
MIAELKDTFRHQGLRKKLIAEIREKKVASDWVLDAMLEVPRHVFFDGVFVEKAYIDQAFPIAAGQTISQPTTVCYSVYFVASETERQSFGDRNRIRLPGSNSM